MFESVYGPPSRMHYYSNQIPIVHPSLLVCLKKVKQKEDSFIMLSSLKGAILWCFPTSKHTI